jgi:hypothetical protein
VSVARVTIRRQRRQTNCGGCAFVDEHAPSAFATDGTLLANLRDDPAGLNQSAAGSDKRQLDATILSAALCRIVRRDRIRVAKSFRRDKVGLNTLRKYELQHVFRTFFRQDLV